MCGPVIVPTTLASTPKWPSASISWVDTRSWSAVSGRAVSPWEWRSSFASGLLHSKSGSSVIEAR